MKSTPGVDFTKLCATSKKLPTHGFCQKNKNIENLIYKLNFVRHLPNLCAAHLAPFERAVRTRRSPLNASHPCSRKKSCGNMLVKLDR
jgi:hypothetical protein